MKPMKIVIDGRVFLDSKPSGVATFARQIILQLNPSTEINYTLVTTGLKKPALNWLPFHIHHVHQYYPNRLLNLLLWLNLISNRRVFGVADIFWLPNPMFIATPDTKTLITWHDLSIYFWPNFFRRWTRFTYNRWVIKQLRAFNDQLWFSAVSVRTKNDIENYFSHWRGRVFLSPPVVKLTSKSINNNVCEKYNLKARYVLFLSTVEPRKNVPSIEYASRRLLAKFPDLDIVIVGNCAVEAEMTRCKILGYVSDDDREGLLKYATVLVYPSYYEGFGFPPLESFKYGVPVVVGAAGSLPEILGDSVLYVSPQAAAEDLPVVIGELLENDSLRQQQINRGYDTLHKLATATEFSFNSLWRKLK